MHAKGRLVAIGGFLAITFIGQVPARGATMIIDAFSDATASWPMDQDDIGAGQLESVTGALGGWRFTDIPDPVTLEEVFDFVQVGIFPSATVFDYSSTIGADAQAHLQYDGNGSLDADFSMTPVVEVVVSAFDYANSLALDVDVMLNDGTTSETVTASLTNAVTGPAQTLSFDFSSFAGSLDLSSITEVLVDLDPGMAGDFRVTEIRAVPEPASFALLALGALGIRRRSRIRRS